MERTRTLLDWKYRRGVERAKVLFDEKNCFKSLDVVVAAIEAECASLDQQWAEIGSMVF